MNLKYRIILAFGAVCIGENIEGVLDIARSSCGILDGVGDVWEHLVDDHIQLLIKEELTDVCNSAGFVGVVLGDNLPLWEDLGVDVGCSPGVIPRIDALMENGH